MNEENNLNNEELNGAEAAENTAETAENTEEIVSEAQETAAEEVAEAAAQTAENIAGEAEDEITADAMADDLSYDSDSAEYFVENTAVKKTPAAAIVCAAIAAVLVIAALVLYFMGYFGLWFNKYNRKYINTTGRTISEVADTSGMTVKEFLELYDLPKSMPANTYESAAFYTMPASKVAEMYGTTFDDLKEQFGLPDGVSEKDAWGDVEGEITLDTYTNGNVDAFKEYYGLGDEVTGETKIKEVRNTIDQKTKEQVDAQKAEEEAAANDNSSSDNAADSSATDVPASEAPASEAPAAE